LNNKYILNVTDYLMWLPVVILEIRVMVEQFQSVQLRHL